MKKEQQQEEKTPQLLIKEQMCYEAVIIITICRVLYSRQRIPACMVPFYSFSAILQDVGITVLCYVDGKRGSVSVSEAPNLGHQLEQQFFIWCSAQTSCISITQELVRNENSWASPRPTESNSKDGATVLSFNKLSADSNAPQI